MATLHSIFRWIDGLNDWVGKKISLLVIALSLLLLLETGMRYGFNSPTVWSGELAQLLFGTYGVLAGGYLLRWNKHVSVDILYASFPLRVQRTIDIVGSVFFFLFCGVLLFVGGSMAWESLTGWEHSQSAWNPPIYPVRMMIPIGALLMLLQGVVKLIRDIISLVNGAESEQAKS